MGYVRASVLNGCRAVLRGKYRRGRMGLEDPGHAESAEATAWLGEAHREVLAALRRLPDRQREAVVLRYFLDFLDMTEDQAGMGADDPDLDQMHRCRIGAPRFLLLSCCGVGGQA
jgi:hypothetical protein